MESLKTFYSEKQVAESDVGFSPSARKPKILARALSNGGLPVELVEPSPVSVEDLYRAHSRAYVDGVLSCECTNGFGNTSPEVARSLPYTSGSFYDAAACSLEIGLASSLTSGFHHAGHSSGGGYCTFNGLMVAACRLMAEGKVRRVAIIDCDQHYGDGTEEIIRALDLAPVVYHVTMGWDFHSRAHGHAYLERLRRLRAEFKTLEPDVILFQAGADCHVDDPLGGCLTTAQMEERDRIVFETAHGLGIPIVFNQAGGYQRGSDGSIDAVIELHLNTFRVAVEVYHIGR